MSTTQDRETILRRAMKLASINAKNATPEEAMLAAERLAVMLRENNLSMRDVDSVKIKTGIRQEAVYDTESRRKWVGWLGQAIATACDCKCIHTPSTSTVPCYYTFMGYEEDAILASWFFSMLRERLPGLCVTHMKSWKKNSPYAYSKNAQTAEKNGFMSGFAGRIHDKIRAIVKPPVMTEENKGEFALIDLKATVVADAYKEAFPRAYTIKEKASHSETGSKAGAACADQTAINIPLADTMQRKALT